MAGHRPSSAVLAACALVIVSSCSSPEVPDGPVSVVLISVDTLRSDRLSAYGYGQATSPHLDALAREGVLFEHAYSHSPLTLPSHASMLTGSLPPRHGVRDNHGYRLGAELPTLAAHLVDAGYRTGAVVSSMVLRRDVGLDRGFEFYDDEMPRRRNDRTFAQRSGRESIARAVSWLDTIDAQAPFFLWLHLFEPHTPRDAPEPYASRFRDSYDAEVAHADALLGQFLAALRQRNRYDEVLIVVVSDHGEGLGDHGESEHGIFLYRESLQVPLILRLPHGRRGGERSVEPAGLVDLLPTVLARIGVAAPVDVDGRDLFAEQTGPAEPIYSETFFARHQYGWSELRSAIDGALHYIQAPRPELYDLREDPREVHELLRRGRDGTSLAAWIEEIGKGVESTANVSPADRARLASLGYVGGLGPTGDGRPLPDPKDHVHHVEELWRQVAQIGVDASGAAERRVLELLEIVGIRNEALFQSLGQNLLRSGRPALVLRLLEPYGASEDPATRVLAGQAALELGRIELSRAHFQEALRSDSRLAEAHLGLGLVLLTMERTSQARGHLARAVELDADLVEGWNGLGVALAQSGDLEGARQHWEHAVTLDGVPDDAWFNLGLVRLKLGRRQEAAAALQRYLEFAVGEDRLQAERILTELKGESPAGS